MLKDLYSLYQPGFTKNIIYMLQAVEYEPLAYLRWLIRLNNFSKVMYRKQLVMTAPAKALLLFLRLGIIAQLTLALIAISHYHALLAAIVLLISAPLLWAYLIIIPLLFGRWLIISPINYVKILKSKKAFAVHPAVKIAVAGSYGKTTMKEMLATVLSEGKQVAATPANKNVSISHARFIEKLKGDEDILVIEFGEGKPGDVKRFAKITRPNLAIVTGIAPAHLDKYKTLNSAAEDIFSVAAYVGQAQTFVNGDSPAALEHSHKSNKLYSVKGLDDWRVDDLKSSIAGLSFTLRDGKEKIKIKSELLGKHQVGPLVAVAVIAHSLGLSASQIEKGLSKIKPFEHRMKPYQLSGAWILDDTYNGNIEGVKAGLKLLQELPAKRKIYVTPGLVDQGPQAANIHRELGDAIKRANPDQVVLIKHSVMPDILQGLEGYKGQLIIEDDPLIFYTNLDKMVAAGDLVLMQNDWPDNYN